MNGCGRTAPFPSGPHLKDDDALSEVEPPTAAERRSNLESLAAALGGVSDLRGYRDRLAEHGLVGHETRFAHLEMDISSKCNIRCRMCYFSFDHYFHGPPTYMRLPQFRAIADALLPYTHTLTLSLGSEPLTSPFFVAILEAAHAYAVPNVTFYTNALLLTDRLIDAVLDNGVTQISISIDGATRETYERIRCGASYDRLLANIRTLVARRNAAGRSHPALRFGVVMMKSNAHELADLVSLAAELGVADMTFCHMVVYEGLGMEGESLVHDKARSNEALAAALARANVLGIGVASHPAPFAAARSEATASTAPPSPADPFRSSVQTQPYCHFPFLEVSINA